MSGNPNAPVLLTFIAPAERCNQRCPSCILDLAGEPVRSFDLSPADYGLIVEQVAAAQIPLLGVSFQGYEVTLPRSWPYVEAVFDVATRLGIRKSFITNGMLLHKWTDRIEALDVDAVVVSLDGADPESHDPIRGLPGAFVATTTSLDRFLKKAPRFVKRIKIASTVYDERNAASLGRLPEMMASKGLSRWQLSFELVFEDGVEKPVRPATDLARWSSVLRERATKSNVNAEIVDVFGFFEPTSSIPTRNGLSLGGRIVRVEPAGYLRVGHELTERFDPVTARRFNPSCDDIARVLPELFGLAR